MKKDLEEIIQKALTPSKHKFSKQRIYTAHERALTLLPVLFNEYNNLPVLDITEEELTHTRSPLFQKIIIKNQIEILSEILLGGL